MLEKFENIKWALEERGGDKFTSPLWHRVCMFPFSIKSHILVCMKSVKGKSPQHPIG
jgi:hypothetical protein